MTKNEPLSSTDFQDGEEVLWIYISGWGGGETRFADAKVVKIHRKRVSIEVKQKVQGKFITVTKLVSPHRLVKKDSKDKDND